MARTPLSHSNIVNSGEHHLELRRAVGQLVGKYGRKYFQDKVRTGGKVDELWGELGEAGFLGVHISEKWGGGGGGISDYNVVVEETSAQGCPLFSMVLQSICSPILEAYGTEELQQRWCPGLGQRHEADVVRHHRTRRWHQHPPDLDHGHTRRRRWVDTERAEVLDVRPRRS